MQQQTFFFAFLLFPLGTELMLDIPAPTAKPGMVTAEGGLRLSKVSIFIFKIPAESLPICIPPPEYELPSFPEPVIFNNELAHLNYWGLSREYHLIVQI